jgi:5'-nucleotidase
MLRKLFLLSAALGMAALAMTAAAQDDETFTLTIMHTNDTHAAHEPNGNGDGGVARQATVVNQIRAEGGNTLLLDAGDRFTGTLFHQLYVGQDQVQVMNLLGYDAMTLGNHEFDNGESVLEEFVTALEFPVVTANVDFSAFPGIDETVSPYTVLEVGGEQIGVIGLTTPDTVFTSTPSSEVGFDTDMAAAVEAAVGELTEQGVNKIILLTHVGIPVDMQLMTQLNGVDVVLGGHSHTLLSNAYAAGADAYPLEAETEAGEPIIYAQAGSNNQYLGRLDVEFDADGLLSDWGGDTILLSRYITPDPEAEALVTELAGPVEELRNTSIEAEAAELLVGDRAVCRVEECGLGNIIADAMIAETGAQIAIMNSGGIRANIEAGDITVGEVLTVLPFGNLISTFELTGADVIAALENGVSTIVVQDGQVVRQGAQGRFPQVGGIRYSFDPNLEPGSRITSVEVMGEDGEYAPIDESATYTVVSNDFLRQGGDAYTVLAENSINPYDFGRPLDEVVAEYMIANSPVTPEIEGRITVENAEVVPLQ